MESTSLAGPNIPFPGCFHFQLLSGPHIFLYLPTYFFISHVRAAFKCCLYPLCLNLLLFSHSLMKPSHHYLINFHLASQLVTVHQDHQQVPM